MNFIYPHSSWTVTESRSVFLGFLFPKACLNKPKAQKSVGQVSDDFAGISLNGIYLTSASDSFCAICAAIDLGV